MSDRDWDRAIQPIVEKVSVDFTKHTQLLSAHEHEQRDNTNKTMVIVTDILVSAVNCPIDVGIVPFSWLEQSCLSISQSTH